METIDSDFVMMLDKDCCNQTGDRRSLEQTGADLHSEKLRINSITSKILQTHNRIIMDARSA